MIGQQLLSLLYGDPANQLPQMLNPGGPNPNPGASQNPPPGGAPGAAPGAPAGGGPPMAPANATQSPPDLASLYVALTRRDQAAHEIDQGTALMASAFGTAQQQHDKMEYARGIPQDNSAGMIGGILVDQKAQKEQQDLNRFQAGAGLAAKLLNIDLPTSQWLMNSPQSMDELLKTHFLTEAQKATPTEAMKNAEAGAQVWAAAHPNATPQEVAAKKDEFLTGAIPGPAGEALKLQAKDAQEFKDTAVQDYTTVQSKLNETENTINKLLEDPDHTVAALKDVTPTTGMGANLNPFLSQKTKDNAVLLNKLKASFSADQLANVKNVRNVREFNTLAQAATGGLDPAGSREQILQTLQTMKDRILDARATSELAAGHKLTGDLVGHGNRDLLDPKSPYYNGATEEEAPKGGGAGGGKTYTYNPKTGLLE